jgi:uncharacterized membrane protein YbhN (UPF0104 family)
VRATFLAAAVALLAWTLLRNGGDLGSRVEDLSVSTLLAAQVAVVLSLVCSMLSWRRLLAGLGSELAVPLAARIFFFGQLGKYLPGGGWSILAHMELARDVAVPRRRAAAATLLAMTLGALSATVVAGLVLSLSPRFGIASPWWALVIPPALFLLLEPRIVTATLNLALCTLRREPLEHRPTRAAAGAATAWAFAAWGLLGIHVWLLAIDLGGSGSRLSLLVLGTYAVAWLAGFVAPLVPAGIGAREAVLTLGLTSTLTAGAAAVLAVASRVLLTVGDLLVVAGAHVAARRHREPARAAGG